MASTHVVEYRLASGVLTPGSEPGAGTWGFDRVEHVLGPLPPATRGAAGLDEANDFRSFINHHWGAVCRARTGVPGFHMLLTLPAETPAAPAAGPTLDQLLVQTGLDQRPATLALLQQAWAEQDAARAAEGSVPVNSKRVFAVLWTPEAQLSAMYWGVPAGEQPEATCTLFR